MAWVPQEMAAYIDCGKSVQCQELYSFKLKPAQRSNLRELQYSDQ